MKIKQHSLDDMNEFSFQGALMSVRVNGNASRHDHSGATRMMRMNGKKEGKTEEKLYE